MSETSDSNLEKMPINEEERNELLIPSNNDNNHIIPLNKLYISGLILIILTFSFNMINTDSLKKELREELKQYLFNQLDNNFYLNQLEINITQIYEGSLKKLEDNLKQYLSLNSSKYIKNNLKQQLKHDLNIIIRQNFQNNFKKYLKDILKPKSKTKVCLCAIGKKENLYAKEFVDYYKSIGYNHIFIYDNNDKGDERFEDVLNEEVSKNFVTIIDYRSYRGIINKPQFDAYYDCYEKNSKEYDWLSFYDFDEFLYLKHNSNIQDFLDDSKFSQCINVKINWIIYSDNDLIYYENIPVQERFTTVSPYDADNKHIKSTVRGHLEENYWKNMCQPHCSNNSIVSCDPTGKIIDPNSPYNSPPNYEFAYIKHFSTKTVEEYLGKIKRGRSDLLVKLDTNYWREKFQYFFDINRKTKEKLDFIKKALNIDIS